MVFCTASCVLEDSSDVLWWIMGWLILYRRAYSDVSLLRLCTCIMEELLLCIMEEGVVII